MWSFDDHARDLESAIIDLGSAQDAPTQRRALKVGLSTVGTLADSRRDQVGSAFYATASSEYSGQVTLGLILVRNHAVHGSAVTESGAAPAVETYDIGGPIGSAPLGAAPISGSITVRALVWLPRAAMPADASGCDPLMAMPTHGPVQYRQRDLGLYDGVVAGREVLATLRDAQSFLVHRTWP